MENTVTIRADSQTGQTSFILDSTGEKLTLARIRKFVSDFDSKLDACLVSIIVDRKSWRVLNFGSLETLRPVSAVELFKLLRDMTKTGMFREIEPFGVEDLISLRP